MSETVVRSGESGDRPASKNSFTLVRASHETPRENDDWDSPFSSLPPDSRERPASQSSVGPQLLGRLRIVYAKRFIRRGCLRPIGGLSPFSAGVTNEP